MTTETKPNAKVEAMAEIIQGYMSASKKDSEVTVRDKKDIYEKTLPEHLTKKMADDLSEHNAVFVPASLLAFGRTGNEVLKNHKSVDTLTTEIPMAGHDKLKLNMARKYVTHPPGDNTKEIVHHGYVTGKLEVRAGRSGSQVKAVRSEIDALVMAAMSK